MLKAVFAATAAVTIAGSTLAYAQPRDGRPDGRRWQPTTEDMRAFQAARLAALRAGLMLSAEQERHWPGFEQAMREIQQMRLNRFTQGRDARREERAPTVDPAERMRQRAARLSEGGAVLKRLADATDPLYRSLDDAQKRRFAILSRTGPRGAWRGRGRDGGDPVMPRGQRRTDAEPTVAPAIEHRFAAARTISGVIPLGNSSDMVVLDDAQHVQFKGTPGEANQFGNKTSQGGNKVITGQGAALSRKIAIAEPTAFGQKPTAFGQKTARGNVSEFR